MCAVLVWVGDCEDTVKGKGFICEFSVGAECLFAFKRAFAIFAIGAAAVNLSLSKVVLD